MDIETIELYKYKRLALSNITKIKITPQSKMQIILGTNGSGKSSLMNELTPLPAIASDFDKNGYKIITINHIGYKYILTNDYSNTLPHSFKKDDEELNPGGTISVQRELVKQEFGIKQDIHDLITDKETFTRMSPSRRKEWFIQLCEANYDYALSVYNKIRERSRDTSGALKLAKKRLVAETSKVVDNTDIEKIQTKIDSIVKEITILYENRSENQSSFNELINEQDILFNLVQSTSEKLLSVKSYFNDQLIWTVDELNDSIEQTKHQIIQVNTKIELYSQEHIQLKNTYDEFVKTGTENASDLKVKREALSNQRGSLLLRKKLSLISTEPIGSLSALESIYEVLVNVFTNLSENEDRRYSNSKLVELENKNNILKDEISTITTRLNSLIGQKEHLDQLKAGNHTTCPQCKHSWIVGFTQDKYNNLVKIIETGQTVLNQKKLISSQLEEGIKDNLEYGNLFRQFNRCVQSVSILKPFWDFLIENNSIYTSPTNVIRLMELFKLDLMIDIDIKNIEDKIKNLDDLIELAIKASNVDLVNMKTRIDVVENELGIFNKELFSLKTKLNIDTQDCKRVSEILSLESKIKETLQLIQNSSSSCVKVLRNEIINDCLKQLQIDLAQQQNKLNDIKMQKGIINDIEKNIEQLTKDEIVLKLLIKTLSPSEGLIAEGLLGFIKHFVKKMNTIINHVWTYRMDVLDCGGNYDEGAELDYKFPLVVNNIRPPITDVSSGSEGQKKIIDSAFKIVSMQYLGLSNFPLYLDEPCDGMDTGHKTAFGVLLKFLNEQCDFSQIYLISHDYIQYASLMNSQFTVLCPSNIVIPSIYNQHVLLN